MADSLQLLAGASIRLVRNEWKWLLLLNVVKHVTIADADAKSGAFLNKVQNVFLASGITLSAIFGIDQILMLLAQGGQSFSSGLPHPWLVAQAFLLSYFSVREFYSGPKLEIPLLAPFPVHQRGFGVSKQEADNLIEAIQQAHSFGEK